MSERYSLRQTPKKTEHSGFVETPRARRPRSIRKSQPSATDDEDSSSAPESKPIRRGSTRKVSLAEKAALNNTFENGHANGDTNGTITVDVDSKNDAVVLEKTERKFVEGWEVGTDPRIDTTGHFDFGGSWGAMGMMIGFPLLMYYMWIGATYYGGKFPAPEEDQSFVDFLKQMGNLVYEGAYPSPFAWAIYWGFLLFEGACYCLLPGITTYGKPLAHMGGRQLPYYCSAVASFYFTIAVAIGLHVTGLFPLYTFIDEFGPLLSVAIASGFIVSIVAYISAFARGKTHRMTGYHIYDFFMGAELNPRMFEVLDFKMFFEVRLPWYILLGLSCATAARQYENYGFVSGEVCFLVMAHWLYANACSKGEECITTTWDMYYEKWGFMLIFWNMAGVPLSYCHCILYLANHHPSTYHMSPYVLGPLFISYLFVYWVWDTMNSQKNRFRSQERGTLVLRNAFPQLPWQTVENPRVVKTKSGDSILADGWYGYARKLHYTCDLFFALSWGFVTGFDSPFPWFYPLFFTVMISHRAYRDIQKCKLKYGEAWDEYTRLVPYLFIPYVI